MMNDIVFKRKAFGGFDREEVMSYINGLLSEKSGLSLKLQNANSSLMELNKKVRELEGENEALLKLKRDNENLNNALEEKTKLLNEANNALSELESLKEQLSKEKAKSEALSAELSVYEADGKAAEELRLKVSSLEAENARLKGMEQQVGAAMLDARLHSEELVKEAKVRADKVTKEVYSAIGDTALKIDGLSTDIGEIAKSFTKAAEEVALRINVLTGNMSKTAQALISDSVLAEAEIADKSELFPDM